jgi:hypothetical protein
MSTNAELYEQDFYAWTQEQATLLEARQWEALDLLHLIEEIESLGRRERHALYDRLIVLLTHLLKLQVAGQWFPYAYDRNKRGWQNTCRTQRLRLARLLEENPSLRPAVATEIARAYAVARLDAVVALQVDEESMPPQCPWTVDPVLDDAFFPEP